MFYEIVDKVGLDANLVYKLLIDLPRELRRKGIELNNDIIIKMVHLLTDKIIIPEQLELALPFVIEKLDISDEEIRSKLNFKIISSEELDSLIANQIELFGKDKLISAENRKRLIPKIVFQILKKCNFSVPGEKIVEKINLMLKEVN